VEPMTLRRGLRKVTIQLRRTNEIMQQQPQPAAEGIVLSQADA
jgi:hypothetical protein